MDIREQAINFEKQAAKYKETIEYRFPIGAKIRFMHPITQVACEGIVNNLWCYCIDQAKVCFFVNDTAAPSPVWVKISALELI